MFMEGTAVLEMECRGMASSDEATLEGLSMLAWTTVLGVVCRGVVAGHGHFRVQLICREECWQGQFNRLGGLASKSSRVFTDRLLRPACVMSNMWSLVVGPGIHSYGRLAIMCSNQTRCQGMGGSGQVTLGSHAV